MQIFQRLFGNHSINLDRALDRTSQRAGLLTQNLSNVNTPGYKRLDTDFAIVLEDEGIRIGDRVASLRERSEQRNPNRKADLRQNGIGADERIIGSRSIDGSGQGGVQQNNGSVRIDGNSVDLENEVLSITETQLRYEALTEMTSRYFRGLQEVIKEGR